MLCICFASLKVVAGYTGPLKLGVSRSAEFVTSGENSSMPHNTISLTAHSSPEHQSFLNVNWILD